ncbi:MAG: hypothetical protein IIC91_12720, partial [Chloroflexi bacterium]|nr:hypothetical protein [Chloroflexota bacterium]
MEHGGEREMLSTGWFRKDEIKRFKQTANSVDAIGDASRHGEVFGVPAKPMSLSEAQTLV